MDKGSILMVVLFFLNSNWEVCSLHVTRIYYTKQNKNKNLCYTKFLHLKRIFKKIYFYLYVCFCHVCAGSKEDIGGHWILWSWSYMWL